MKASRGVLAPGLVRSDSIIENNIVFPARPLGAEDGPARWGEVFKGGKILPQIYSRRGFTWVELVAILVFLAIVLGILIPAVLQIRERNRRTTCINNLKTIGLGMHNYYDARKYFPCSSDLRSEGKKNMAGGWSFLFKILPDMEEYQYSSTNPLDLHSKTLDPLKDNGTTPSGGGSGTNAIAYARDTSISEFLCPANPNQIYEFPSAPTSPVGQKHAVTNYKALGATSMESLMLSLDPESPPPYGDKSQHPDGVLFPGKNGITQDNIKDGLANTIMVVETIDDTKSAWIAGSDVNLVGMANAGNYQKYPDNSRHIAPLDYNGKFYIEAAPGIQAMRTFQAYDFRPGHKDAGTYPAGVGRTPAYGPSSGHPGVVNHLFCDGSVRSLRKDIDYAAYFFLITRDNGDKRSPAEDE